MRGQHKCELSELFYKHSADVVKETLIISNSEMNIEITLDAEGLSSSI